MAAATLKKSFTISSSSSGNHSLNFTVLSSSPTMTAQLPYDIPTLLLFPIRPQNPKTLEPPILHPTQKKTPLSLDLSLSGNNNSSDHNSSKKRPLVAADSGSKTPIIIIPAKKTPPVSLDLSLSSGSTSESSGSHQGNHKRMKFSVRPRNKNKTTTTTDHHELRLGFNNGPFWGIRKTLTKSDLGHLSRLIVASEDVQNNIIPFWDAERVGKVETEEGVTVRFWDCDTNSEHAMVFKRWKSSGRYVFNKNWIQQFVNRRGLQEGDQIGISWDQGNSRFNFSLLKHA